MTCWLQRKKNTHNPNISKVYIVFSTSTRLTPVLINNCTVFKAILLQNMHNLNWSIALYKTITSGEPNRDSGCGIHSCSSVIMKSKVIFIWPPPPKRGLLMLNISILKLNSATLQHKVWLVSSALTVHFLQCQLYTLVHLQCNRLTIHTTAFH